MSDTPIPPIASTASHGSGNQEEEAVDCCTQCGAPLDLSQSEPLTRVICPHCNAELDGITQIERFQLRSLLGRGGMGSVFRAWDPSLEREIAIKVLRAKYSQDHEYTDRLQREAGLMAKLTDPNVVRIYSSGSDRGRFYLAMELIECGTLQDLLDEHVRISEMQALSVAIQVAGGLRSAFQRGVTHRDVKPGNILFASETAVKITDFGLAESIDETESESGEIVGTPYYISPERLDGAPEDCRSDIYSLGATLFHMITGRPPFEAESAVAVALKRRDSEAVSVQTFAPHISSATAYIVNGMLRRSPSERPQSYDDLIEQLTYAQNSLRTGVVRKRVVLEDERHQKTTAIITIAMIALAAVAALGFFFFGRSERASSSPRRPAADHTAAAGVTGSDAALLHEGTDKLAEGNFSAAADAFTKAGSSKSVSETTKEAATLCKGIAELCENDLAAAASVFSSLGENNPSSSDPALDAFAAAAARGANSPADTGNPLLAVAAGNPLAPLGNLIIGLRIAAEGNPEKGLEYMRKFRAAKLPRDTYPWASALQPMVTLFGEYNAEFQSLAAIRKSSQSLRDALPLLAKADRLHAFYRPEAGRLKRELLAQLEELSRTSVDLPKLGYYRIVNHNSKKGIDVVNAQQGPRSATQQQTQDPSKISQQFLFYPIGFHEYRIEPRFEPRMCLDLDNNRSEDDTKVTPYPANGSVAQRWILDKQGDGTFKISAAGSRKMLAIGAASKSDGAPLIQWTDNGGLEQRWELIPVAEDPAPEETTVMKSDNVLVDLRATDPSAGEETWANHGALGAFHRQGNAKKVMNVLGTHIPAVQFDGAGACYEGPLSDKVIEGGSPRTIEVWVYKTDLKEEEAMVSWARRGTPLRNMSFNFGSKSEWGAVVHWDNDLGWGERPPEQNVWHHLACTYSNRVERVYRDGAMANGQIFSHPLETSGGDTVRIGCQHEGDGTRSIFFSGYINSVRVLHGALAPEQIALDAAMGPLVVNDDPAGAAH